MTNSQSETERCPIGKALDALPDEDRSEVQAILDNHVKSVTISVWLTEMRNFKRCTTAAVNAHRKGTCVCS